MRVEQQLCEKDGLQCWSSTEAVPQLWFLKENNLHLQIFPLKLVRLNT